MKNLITIFAISGITSLNGCAYFTPPLQQPVIKASLSPGVNEKASVGTLSLTPDRRVVLVNYEHNRFCAEAPTEVGTDLSSVMRAAAEADVPAEVKAKVGAVAALASSNAVLNRRTQGMQLFLSNSYFVCQMYMNKAINEEQLLRYQLEVFNSASKLIEAELPYMYGGVSNGVSSAKKETSSKNKPIDTDRIIQDLLNIQQGTEPISPAATP
ncbi:hypothetical protein LVV80_14660 [Pseudomonas sp. KCA11]|uniref:hypothetical protein n=1 Tax=Pseudomonas sp. KCA11 TaxID=2899114 RepID=UPI001F284098|nr:hypothetical protein [Pseudomonas sp. KCA11]MCE5993264.1 hypothetical protein [Pseudomonas sp. KCA11]